MEKYLDIIGSVSVIVILTVIVFSLVIQLVRTVKRISKSLVDAKPELHNLIDAMNNHNYQMAKSFIESLQGKPELTPLEQRKLESARTTITTFESYYDVTAD